MLNYFYLKEAKEVLENISSNEAKKLHVRLFENGAKITNIIF